MEPMQCILNVARTGLELKIDRKRVRRTVEDLCFMGIEMDIEEKPYGLLISLKNYHELIKKDSEEDSVWTVRGQCVDSERTPLQKETIGSKGSRGKKKGARKIPEIPSQPTTDRPAPIPLSEEDRNYGLSIGLTDGDLQAFEDFFTFKRPWQEQDTFVVQARLRTWARNVDKYGHSKKIEFSSALIWPKTATERMEFVVNNPNKIPGLNKLYLRDFPREHEQLFGAQGR